jgi:rhamnosyltransferase
LTVGVFIPAFNAARELPAVLNALLHGSCPVKIVIGDCSSTDETAALAKSYGVDVMQVAAGSFNHGLTREEGRRRLGTDIVVMMTQDAYPANARTIESLIRPILSGEAAVTYARQVPRSGAGFVESFRRLFNYPDESQIRGIEDADRYGFTTFFCSNSCAAYKTTALDSVGGFWRILSHEDFCISARLLVAGFKIAYVADSIVVHSHRWTLKQEFRRAFDAGYVQADHPWLTEIVGGAERRGIEFATACLQSAWESHRQLIPHIVFQSLVRWAGYRMGYAGRFSLPLALKRKMSSQPCYFTRTHLTRRRRQPVVSLEIPQSSND